MDNYIIIGIIVLIAVIAIGTLVKRSGRRVAVAAEAITSPERRSCKL